MYRLLIEGVPQARVARIMGVSRQRVSQITRQLVEGGRIRCVNPRGKPKFYEATGRRPADVKAAPSGTGQPLCRVHLVACVASILEPPRRPVEWDREWTLPNGNRYFSRKEVLSGQAVCFTRMVTRSADRLIIFMPERWLTAEQLRDYKAHLEGYARSAAVWFAQRYDCQLGLLELYQKPHFAFRETNEIAAAAQLVGMTWGEFWVDDSEGQREWETTELELAMAKAQAPKRILDLERRLDSLECSTRRLLDAIPRLEGKIEQLLEFQKTPVRPPDDREVA
ncbi:MAG: helix-turn-helix domain-containing protein [Candidatus Thermoplasmatota archaeon]|nr:helix-turn-helix domain-containing protein [Candidatus Thermoplasmatota archaeon]